MSDKEKKYNPLNCNHDCKLGTCAFCDEMQALNENSRPCTPEENAIIMKAVKSGEMKITYPTWIIESE